MSYADLSEYDGSKTGCDQCERQFEEGEVITVDERRGYVFCYSDAMAGCLLAHAISSGEVTMGNPMRFGGSPVLPPSDTTPNYHPGEPIPINEEKSKRFDWLRRLLDFD